VEIDRPPQSVRPPVHLKTHGRLVRDDASNADEIGSLRGSFPETRFQAPKLRTEIDRNSEGVSEDSAVSESRNATNETRGAGDIKN
jgi:hypothetical protein